MRISWDENRVYSRGVSRGVLYPQNSPGVPWNGLISILSKGDSSPASLYLDGQKYRDRITPSFFEGTLNAYTYPDEFEQYNGVVSGITGQNRKSFGLSYWDNNEIHLLYNVIAQPSSDQYSSLGGDVSVNAFSWGISSLPAEIPTAKASSHIVIVVAEADPGALSDLEDLIYGDPSNDPSLPDPATIIDIFESHTTLRITDNGDGTWTAEGPNEVVSLLNESTFQINWPSAVIIDEDTYRVYSL